jgi:hypothetical protein
MDKKMTMGFDFTDSCSTSSKNRFSTGQNWIASINKKNIDFFSLLGRYLNI